jgi:type III secretion protein C
MHYFARNSQLADVLRDVATAGGLPVDIARDVRGTVNGAFDEPPARVFAKLTEAYGLAWYFDGRTIHVSSGSDVRSRAIAFAPMTRDAVAGLLRSLDLDDAHLPVRYSDTTAKVTGPSRFVDAIADAIEKARQQTTVEPQLDQTQIRVFPLRYAQAQDITYTTANRSQTVPGIASLLRRLMGDTHVIPRDRRAGPSKEARTPRAGPPPLPSLRGLGLADTAQSADAPPPDEVVQSDVTPARRNIVADARTNSVVVYDVPSMMPNYERAIAMLDRPQDLVEITALVIDVSTDAIQELGIRWGGGARGRDGSAYATVNANPQGDQGLFPALQSAAPGLNLATLIGNSAHYLFGQIQALEETGKARILSRPQVLTLNNSEAVLSSRNSVYVRVAGNQDVDLFNVDTGLTLRVTPTVESTGDKPRNILLSVQIEDGGFDSSLSVDGIPKVNNHSIVTQAVVSDGESLLIGGYEYDRSETSRSQVPFLGDIPYVGALFSNKQTTTQRLERLILITPRLKSMTGDGPRAVSGRSAGAAAPAALESPANVTGALLALSQSGSTGKPRVGSAGLKPPTLEQMR